MITIDKVTFTPGKHAIVITGNGGEEELVVFATPGQSGHTYFLAVASSTDSEPELHMQTKSRNNEEVDVFESILRKWVSSGLSATIKEKLKQDKNIRKAMIKFRDRFEPLS